MFSELWSSCRLVLEDCYLYYTWSDFCRLFFTNKKHFPTRLLLFQTIIWIATVKETRKKFTWVWLFYHPSCFYFLASDYVESTISIFCAMMLLMNCASPLVIFIFFVVRDGWWGREDPCRGGYRKWACCVSLGLWRWLLSGSRLPGAVHESDPLTFNWLSFLHTFSPFEWKSILGVISSFFPTHLSAL